MRAHLFPIPHSQEDVRSCHYFHMYTDASSASFQLWYVSVTFSADFKDVCLQTGSLPACSSQGMKPPVALLAKRGDLSQVMERELRAGSF